MPFTKRATFAYFRYCCFLMILLLTNQGFRLSLRRKRTVSPWLNKRELMAKTHSYYYL